AQDGLASASCGNCLLQAGPVVGAPAGQVFVEVLADDGISMASAVGAAAHDLLFHGIAFLGVWPRGESGIDDGGCHWPIPLSPAKWPAVASTWVRLSIGSPSFAGIAKGRPRVIAARRPGSVKERHLSNGFGQSSSGNMTVMQGELSSSGPQTALSI